MFRSVCFVAVVICDGIFHEFYGVNCHKRRDCEQATDNAVVNQFAEKRQLPYIVVAAFPEKGGNYRCKGDAEE